MRADMQWNVKLNDMDYYIVYSGMNFWGKVSLSVNGTIEKFCTTYQKGIGYWVLFNCGPKKCLLRLDISKTSGEVFIHGLPVSQNPVIDDLTGEPDFQSVELNRKVRNGTSSFFSIIILTLVNVFLLLFDAPIAFPFSLFGTTLVLGMGMGFADEFGNSVILGVALVVALGIIGFYAVLYYHSIRSVAPVWIAFAFLLMDTVGLILFGIWSQDMLSILIDIAFHAWILWSILQLGIAKKNLTHATLAQISAYDNPASLFVAGS